MAQKRFWNYRDDDSTASFIRWLLGVLDAGRYKGFDFSPNPGMNLTLNHDTSGSMQIRDDLSEIATGLIITRQGVIVQEDEALTLPISTTSANPRIDIIVLTHRYEANLTGLPASYAIIQGVPAVSPIAPQVADAKTDIILGELYLPANCTNLNQAGVVYSQSKVPRVGLDEIDYSKVLNTPSDFTPAAHTHTSSEVGLGNLPNAKSDSFSLNSTNTLATSKAVQAAVDNLNQSVSNVQTDIVEIDKGTVTVGTGWSIDLLGSGFHKHNKVVSIDLRVFFSGSSTDTTLCTFPNSLRIIRSVSFLAKIGTGVYEVLVLKSGNVQLPNLAQVISEQGNSFSINLAQTYITI